VDLATLSTIVTLLIALSVAAERLVEIIKGLIPFLSQQNSDAVKESWRQAALQAMAVAAGIVTALLTAPMLPHIVPGLGNNLLVLLALGLLVSGGSGFWHSIQDYVNALKEVQSLLVEEQKKKQTTS
jgi:hypothetical protein